MVEKKKLELEFLNSLNKKYVISIDDPKPDLLPEEVQTAMESIISEDVFEVSQGSLEEAVEARIVTTTIDVLE